MVAKEGSHGGIYLYPFGVILQGYGRLQDGNYMSEGLSETLNGLPSILSYLVP